MRHPTALGTLPSPYMILPFRDSYSAGLGAVVFAFLFCTLYEWTGGGGLHGASPPPCTRYTEGGASLWTRMQTSEEGKPCLAQPCLESIGEYNHAVVPALASQRL